MCIGGNMLGMVVLVSMVGMMVLDDNIILVLVCMLVVMMCSGSVVVFSRVCVKCWVSRCCRLDVLMRCFCCLFRMFSMLNIVCQDYGIMLVCCILCYSVLSCVVLVVCGWYVKKVVLMVLVEVFIIMLGIMFEVISLCSMLVLMVLRLLLLVKINVVCFILFMIDVVLQQGVLIC